MVSSTFSPSTLLKETNGHFITIADYINNILIENHLILILVDNNSKISSMTPFLWQRYNDHVMIQLLAKLKTPIIGTQEFSGSKPSDGMFMNSANNYVIKSKIAVTKLVIMILIN